jgi:TRAP-type transport system small permease protein
VLTKLYAKILEKVSAFIGLFLVLVIVIIFVQVLLRYVFFYSLEWSEELCRYLFVWTIFLGACLSIRDNSQIRIDFIDNIVKGKGKKLLLFFQYTISLIIVAVILFASLSFVQLGMRSTSAAMQIPMYLVYAIIPIGMGLIALELSRKILHIFKKDANR